MSSVWSASLELFFSSQEKQYRLHSINTLISLFIQAVCSGHLRTDYVDRVLELSIFNIPLEELRMKAIRSPQLMFVLHRYYIMHDLQ